MSNKPTYQIKVCQSSHSANILLFITVLAGVFCCYFFTRSLSYSIEFSLGTSVIFSLFLLGVCSPRTKPFNLLLNESGELTFWFEHIPHIKISGDICKNSYATSLFCVVHLISTHPQNPKRLLIWKDSIDDNDFRRLSRVIRLIRNQI